MTTGARAQAYRPDIDGLRCVAVMAVVLFHVETNGLEGGYLGVDVFFVISGYLITGLLMREAAEGGVDFAGFYIRRIRRLYPALLCTVAATLVAGLLFLSPPQLEAAGLSAAAALVSASNFFFWLQSGYFEDAAITKPLLHTWSLSVEEQFYLVWPALVASVAAIAPVRRAGMLFAGLFTAGAASNLLVVADASTIFYMTPFRAFQFAAGAVVATLAAPSRHAGALSVGGAALLLLAFALGANRVSEEGVAISTVFADPGAAVAAVGAAALIAAGPAGPVNRLLSLPPFVAIGRISYSVYLVHWPLTVFAWIAGGGRLTDPMQAAVVAASLLLGWLQWKHVEERFRRTALPGSPGRGFLAPVAATSVAILSAGLLLAWSKGIPARVDPNLNAYVQAVADRDLAVEGECRLVAADLDDARLQAAFDRCHERHGPPAALLGDSHGTDLFRAVAHASSRPFLLSLARDGCRPFRTTPDCDAFFARLDRFTEANAGRLGPLFLHLKGTHFSLEPDRFRAEVDPVVTYFQGLAKRAAAPSLTWIGPRAELEDDPRKVLCTPFSSGVPQARWVDRLAAIDRRLQDEAARAAIPYISTLTSLARTTGSPAVVDGASTYSDTNHWSATGERLFGSALLRAEPALAQLR